MTHTYLPPLRSKLAASTALASAILLFIGQGAATAQDEAPKWGPHLEIGGKAGTDRSLGEAAMFVPLFQTFDRLIFTDVRGTFDNSTNQELNVGLGVRQIIDGRWILGAYGFYDLRKSESDNVFHQLTFGAEAMTEAFSLRGNVYLPIGDTDQSDAKSDSASFVGGSIIAREGREVALTGFDAEAGLLLKGLNLTNNGSDQFWLHGGGYAFFDDDADTIWGPRLRAEYRINDIITTGSRLSFQAEYQYDEPRGGQAFFGARLRLPLQQFYDDRPRQTLSPLELRMTETVIRDIDVVTSRGDYGQAVVGIDTVTGSALDNVTRVETTRQTDLGATIQAADADQVLFLDTNGDRVEISDTITLQANQRVAGGFIVRNPLTGRTVSLGRDVEIHGTDDSKNLFAMADGSSLSKLALSGGATAVHSDGNSNVSLDNLAISDVAVSGVNFENGAQLTLVDSTFTNINFENADEFSNFNPLNTDVGVAVRLNRADKVTIRNVTAEAIGMGLFANVSTDVHVTNMDITRSASEGVVFHYVLGGSLDRVDIDTTGADGAAFVVSADIDYTNSTLSNLGALANLGVRSGINISSFSGDSSILVGTEANKGYNFSNLKISNATNSGMFLQEVRDSSFNSIKIEDVDIIGIQLSQFFNPTENVTFNDVEIENAGRAGFWMSGAISAVTGSITTTNTPQACGRSQFMTLNLSQPGGERLLVNGSEVTPAEASTTCVPVANF